MAWLCFTAATYQDSAFLSLQLVESIGMQLGGLLVTNCAAQPGRVVVVGDQPLLEVVLGANRQPELILYGRVGRNHVIETNPDLSNTNAWQPTCQATMTNLWQTCARPDITNQTMFFRARRS